MADSFDNDVWAAGAGRTTRTVTPAIRRALNARDQGCVFPHWSVHEGGWTLTRSQDGSWTSRPPRVQQYAEIESARR